MSLASFLRDNARFLLSGGLLSLTSSYGQTYFIAIFAGQIMAEFALSDGEWGLIYTLSTTISALVMLWAGALTDTFRVRSLALIVLPTLAALCILMGLNTSVAGLALIVFALRLFGQGMTSQLAITAMARWFVARRGLALSISAMGFAIGQSLLPILSAALLERIDWRTIWMLAALPVLLIIPLLLWLLSQERTPQSIATETNAVGMDGRHWTRKDVVTSPLFWMLMPMLLGPPAWGTSLFFQQVHIADVKGWDLIDYFALIPLLTAVSVCTTLISGQLIDRFGSSGISKLYLLPFAVSFLILGLADSLWMAGVGFMVFGIGAGFQATLPAAFWSEFFGTRYIGAIKAVSTSIMVFGSAIGPGISGVLIDLGYSFPEQCTGIAVYFVVAALMVWLGVRKAEPRLPHASEIKVERA